MDAGLSPQLPTAPEKPAGVPPKLQLLGLNEPEWKSEVGALLGALSQPAYRGRQLRDWVFQKTPDSFALMSDLPLELRQHLDERAELHPLHLREERISTDRTRKYLWERRGSGPIESVLIPEDDESDDLPQQRDARSPARDRVTYCLSTQAGCPVKCTFCATGYSGFEGQLSAAEIVDQVVQMRRISGQTPTNIVYMGMGEPLLNFPATLRSLEVLVDRDRLALGSRRITVSTVGVPERIVELGERFPQVKLALSLHAARDPLRTELIPLNRKHPIAEILAAVREHQRITQKLPTIEYVVLPDVNDGPEDARALGEVLRGLPSRINLIEFNPFDGVEYRKPEVRRMVEFRNAIQRHFQGPVTIRRSRGGDIHGACGQLMLASREAPAPSVDAKTSTSEKS